MLTRVRTKVPKGQDPSARDEFFENAKSSEVSIKHEGRSYTFMLPLRYYDWSLMLANFPAPTASIRALLPSRTLVPVELLPGLSVVTLVAFDHRRVEGLDRYQEVSVMMPVRLKPRWNVPLLPLLFPHWFPDLGFWVEHLPVTSQPACDAGVAIWGFPKVVHDIRFEEVDGVRRCVWRDGGREVLTFEMRIPAALTPRRMNFRCFPCKDGLLGPTLFETKAPYFETRWPGGARVRLGDHEIAERLRRLGMWSIAFGRLFAPRGLSMLHGPSDMLPV